MYMYRSANLRRQVAVGHLQRRKDAEDYINKLRVSAGFGIKTNVIETMRGLTERLDPCVISTLGLSMRLKSNKKYVLREVSAHFPPASLNAVMGPSGAGKTTFMNALAGRANYGDISGKILIDGVESQFGQKGSPKIGYVPQDDIMHDNYTVYQNLYYSAMLRLPADMPKAQKLRIIDDVLLVLELDHLIDQRIGNAEARGISGGQKKRVNIGMELVAYPRVLFLDEPTSGLDSTASIKVCQCLKRLTSLGITVICVIHQPRYSIFRSFDNVLLLGKGGQTVYHGSTGGVDEYFKSLGFVRNHGENIADWFIDITSGYGVRFGSEHRKQLQDQQRTLPGVPLPDVSEDEEDSSDVQFKPDAEQASSNESHRPSRTVSGRKKPTVNELCGDPYELEDLFDEWIFQEDDLIKLMKNLNFTKKIFGYSVARCEFKF